MGPSWDVSGDMVMVADIDAYVIQKCTELIDRIQQGEDDLDLTALAHPELARALQELLATQQQNAREHQQLDRITARINAGLTLDDILENIYTDFREIIPYNRIGLALLDDGGQTVSSRWNKSDHPIRLGATYRAPLAGSSLETIIATGQPRILNDLEDYLRHKPHSKSTRLIVAEGMRASLTCPLITNGAPVGFLFFSSAEPHVYQARHSAIFQRIAAQLSVIIEKGELVTTMAAQNAAIEQQRNELQQSNELKNTFLGIAAHDLRSPLSVINMAASVLLDSPMETDPEETHAVLSTILDQTRHMLTLIDSLLDVSLIEAGKLELMPEEILLAHFLNRAIDDHERLAASKGSVIQLDASFDGSESITGDPLRLRQVMDNLLSNAIKFSPADSTIRVFAGHTPSGWRISVQDEGPGIQPEDRQRLFVEFERLSAQPTGGERSTGLGLAITRRVIEAHRGQIGVDSEPGHGSTFWFILPD
jgi:signal transduction histidine kinase